MCGLYHRWQKVLKEDQRAIFAAAAHAQRAAICLQPCSAEQQVA
jgi:antirestriction protein ArdC